VSGCLGLDPREVDRFGPEHVGGCQLGELPADLVGALPEIAGRPGLAIPDQATRILSVLVTVVTSVWLDSRDKGVATVGHLLWPIVAGRAAFPTPQPSGRRATLLEPPGGKEPAGQRFSTPAGM
jgi:hypothetical protein